MNRPSSFALHIQPLFTSDQRTCMIKSFDLAKYEDVKKWSAKIAHSLSAKTMPADASNPWPDEWIALFNRWWPKAVTLRELVLAKLDTPCGAPSRCLERSVLYRHGCLAISRLAHEFHPGF